MTDEEVVLLQPSGASELKAFTNRTRRAAKRHAAAPPTKKVFLAQSYAHTERLLSDFEGYLVASENKAHPNEVGGACHSSPIRPLPLCFKSLPACLMGVCCVSTDRLWNDSANSCSSAPMVTA